VGEINVGCAQCEWCRQGRRAHCQYRRALGIRGKDGAFATHITLPAINLHLVPSHVPDEAAVFTEPLAAALQIRQQIAIRPKDRLAVLGDGKLGQLVARALAGTGCDGVLKVLLKAQ
jgi:threonine dehydrogenase-like Zn-dependent dehydrogenase